VDVILGFGALVEASDELGDVRGYILQRGDCETGPWIHTHLTDISNV
jgi:hypothetical protein